MTPAALLRFVDDYVREGYTVEPMGTYYKLFDLRVDARHIEDAGNATTIRFKRDAYGYPDGIELLKLVPKEGNGSIEGGEQPAVIPARFVGVGKVQTPSDLDSQPAPCNVDYENGCSFCGHIDCADACCDKCHDPKCYRTYGVCPTCTAQADKASKDAA